MNNVHFAIPEIYGDSLSYYGLLRKLVKAMNTVIENYNTIPDQIAEEVKNLDASQLFSAVLNQFIHSIATDNTKSANAVKVYKKHDLLYATFNETVNLYESLIDFSTGTSNELIPGTNIREVNISELFIELRTLIDDETQTREQADTTLQQSITAETSAREQADTTLQQSITAETSAREQGDTTLQQSITAETSAREQADTNLQQNINAETTAREQADNNKVNKSDVLTLEEIRENSDLSGKIASASALKFLFPNYSLLDSNYDFNNIPHATCYGTWFGTAQHAPSSNDGNYMKIGDIIIAIDWNDNKYIKYKWGNYRNWVSF